MAFSYYKVFKVPVWVLVSNCKVKDAVVGFFTAAAAKEQSWPSKQFKDTVHSFKQAGWGHVFENEIVVIPPQLLNIALMKHVKDYINPLATLAPFNIQGLNRSMKKEEDYEKLFNDCLDILNPVVLSQLFRVGEVCHDENARNRPQLWVSSDECSKSVVSKIAQNVVTIGEGSGFDINVRNLKVENLNEFLQEKILAFYKN